MRNLSSEFREKVNSGMDIYYLKYAEIMLKDGTKLSLDNSNFWANGFSFEDAVSSNETFDIGSVIINKFTLTINNIDDRFSEYIFEDAEATVWVGLELPSGIEKIRICTGTVAEEPKQRSSIITLSFYDNMIKLDRDYTDVNTVFPATRGQIVRDICSVCGVTLHTITFENDNYYVQTRPDNENLTCRQMLSWVLQIGCQFAKCDEYGRMVIRWYNNEITEENSAEIDSFAGAPTLNLDDVIITGVRVTEYIESTSEEKEAESYLYGTEGYVLEIAGNKLVSEGTGNTIANMIGERCVGMRFRPFSATCITDISIESGDSVIIKDRKGNIFRSYVTLVNLNPGNFEKISCGAKSAARNSAKQYSQITQAVTEARKNVQKEKTEREKALEELAEKLGQSEGVFTTVVKTENGGNIYYLHNKPKLEESDIVWRMTAEAWAVSTDGGKTWNAGMAVDGDTIVRILTATGINADWIDTGSIFVKDEAGNVIFMVNIDTGQVIIDGSHIQIGDKTLDQALEETGTLSMQLSNEYANVPVDKDGNYKEINVSVKPSVFYGMEDITGNCVFTFTESQNISGRWNNTTKIYTVESLTADTAWIDIRAVYLNKYTITKRFTVVKVYGGADGKTYTMESTASLIEVVNGGLSSDSVTFKGYAVSEAVREEYAGRFVIRECDQNGNWTTVYTSEQDETNITYSLYNVYTVGNGDALVVGYPEDSAQGGFGILTIPRTDIKEIECTLYAAGGTESILFVQRVSVIKNVDSLTQDDIFNSLTNNGEWKGLYKEGNNIFISFDYARGGILKLGGKEYGNGEIRVYDEAGNEIGYWTKNGLFSKKGTFEGVIKSEYSGRTTEIGNGRISFYKGSDRTGSINPIAWGNDFDESEGVTIGTSSKYLSLSDTSDSGKFKASYVLNNGLNPNNHTEKNIFYGKTRFIDETRFAKDVIFSNSVSPNKDGILKAAAVQTDTLSASGLLSESNFIVWDNFYVIGIKARAVKTGENNYICMNAVESPEALFSDYGSGVISSTGEISIFFDPVFVEAIDMDCEYQVFVTKTSKGMVDFVEKKKEYFIVRGESGTSFDWSAVCKQKDYEATRMKTISIDKSERVDFDESIFYGDDSDIGILDEIREIYEREVDLL